MNGLLKGKVGITIIGMDILEKSWTGVIGHEWAIDLLTGASTNDRLSHAYLLIGPAHIGKTTLALAFAQALNCEKQSMVPCQTCRSCRLIAQGVHPDVRTIEPAQSASGRTETLKIEQIRDLQKDLILSPYEGRYRVIIITRFNKASAGAANALLKTLEEPPDHVKILVTADHEDALLPTIISRCQSLSLRPLPRTQIERALIDLYEASADQANLLSHLSGGRLGLAVHLLKDPDYGEQRSHYIDLLENAFKLDLTARFQLANRIANQKGAFSVQDILELWLVWWRDVILSASTKRLEPSITNIDRHDQIQTIAKRLGPQAAVNAARATQRAMWRINHNANLRLAMEVLMLDLPWWNDA